MIHLYCGDGKGKTTAAMGLALRMAGRGRDVLVVQFLKGSDSGERFALEALDHVTLLPLPERLKFVWTMTPAEKEAEAARCSYLLRKACDLLSARRFGLLVLDEACGAMSQGLLPLQEVLDCLTLCRSLDAEAVLTGRDPHPDLVGRCHYVTEMVKRKHPFDSGASAREGVEF